MALCYGPRCSFRFQKHCYVAVKPKLSHLFSTIQQAKRIKTIHEIPGHRNYFPSFRAVLQLLHTKLTRRNKPDRKLYLEKQFKEVEKFGPIYKVELPGLRAINLVDPTEVAKILRSEPKYPTRFDLPILKYYRNTRKALPGIFFADGEDWYRYRSMARKRILRPQDVAEHVPVFNDIITDFMTRLDAIRGPAGSDAEHEVKDIDNELFKWSFESVAHVLFDKRFGCLDNEVNLEAQGFIKSIGIFISTATKLNFLPVWVYNFYKTDTFKEFVFHYDNMYKYADLIIKRKVQELEQKEKLDLQMPAQNLGHTTPEKVGFVEYLLSNEKLSRDDLFASIIDLLFAGVDTTSNTMQWFLYMMAKNQDKQEKLFQEVRNLTQFAVDLDFVIEEYAASKGKFPPRKRRKKKTLYIATIEKANGLVNSFIEESRIDSLGLVVVDELHMIGEGGRRGSTIELCLTKLLYTAGHVQIIAMSATLGNIKELQQFMKAEVYTNDFRPVKLNEYIKMENKIYEVIDSDITEQPVRCIPVQCTIPYGVAYHHGGLTMDERKLIEDSYSKGTLCVLTCTSTLAAGVNLPAKRVIVRAPYVGCKVISRSQYKQMIGRAGRAGIDTSGESILILKEKDKYKVALSSDKEKKATSTIGISEIYLLGKAYGQKLIKCTDEAAVYRFYMTLILYKLVQGESIWMVADLFKVPRGFVQNLLTSAASYATCLVHFTQVASQ
ncbi:hypothetical protein QZH41_002083 [Actinostola sp. cb2023]|nr:hypothetical protein QZH41_002083 [Actinostola sp. cb2023]